MATSGSTNDNEWYNEWQRVTTNANERKRITTYDNEWQRVVILLIFFYE